MEYFPPVPIGFEATQISAGDEHLTVRLDGSIPPLGSTLDFIPGQIRTTFNLHERVQVSRRGHLID